MKMAIVRVAVIVNLSKSALGKKSGCVKKKKRNNHRASVRFSVFEENSIRQITWWSWKPANADVASSLNIKYWRDLSFMNHWNTQSNALTVFASYNGIRCSAVFNWNSVKEQIFRRRLHRNFVGFITLILVEEGVNSGFATVSRSRLQSRVGSFYRRHIKCEVLCLFFRVQVF